MGLEEAGAEGQTLCGGGGRDLVGEAIWVRDHRIPPAIVLPADRSCPAHPRPLVATPWSRPLTPLPDPQMRRGAEGREAPRWDTHDGTRVAVDWEMVFFGFFLSKPGFFRRVRSSMDFLLRGHVLVDFLVLPHDDREDDPER